MLVIIATSVAVAAYASSLVRVHRPEEPVAGGPNAQIVVPPLLPPAGDEQYRLMDPVRAAKESGLPVAYLRQAPKNLNEDVAVSLWPQPQGSSGKPAMLVRSIVRYRGSGHTVLVVLDEPSTEMAQQQSLILGERTVWLANGQEGWLSSRPEWPQSNVVSIVKDRYVVVVASDLPVDEVLKLATRVVVTPPGTVQSIPSDWPTPIPQERKSDADIVLVGEVRSGGTWHKPYLDFDVSIGNRGGVAARDVQVTMRLSEALADRVLKPYSAPSLGEMGPGERASFGGSIAFDMSGLNPAEVRAALDEGLEFEVTWTQNGQFKSRTFRFANGR